LAAAAFAAQRVSANLAVVMMRGLLLLRRGEVR
jgi:hypothetical protein